MKTEKRYLNTWHYNAALILTELEKIVINNGGRLCSTWERSERINFEIINRGLDEQIHKYKETVNRFERLTKKAPCEITRELERLQNINNEPRNTFYADYLYISFVYNDHYYYYQMDRNPFFDFLFIKTKLINENTTARNVYGSTPSREWMLDCFWHFDCSPEDRREAANLIFNELVNAAPSKPYQTKERKNKQTLYFMEA